MASSIRAGFASGRGPSPSSWAPASALAAIALLIALFFGRIGGHPLQDPDEGRYAEIPREMIETGDWLTPRLDYVKYYEKPPLFYWLVGLSFLSFGLGEGAARAVPAAAGLATVFLTYALGRAALSRRAAWMAGAILVSAPLFFGLSQAVLIDIPLTALMTATLGAFWCSQRAERPERKRAWAVAAAAAAALGVLAKGLVAVVLPGALALAFLALERDGWTLRTLLGWRPLAAFAAIALPWFALVIRAHPEFFDLLIVREHFGRFAGAAGHRHGPLYYLPVLLLGSGLWGLLAIGLAAAPAGRRAARSIPREPRRFLLLWAVGVFAFFTASSAKLAPYVLPAWPAMALLLAAWLERVVEQDEALLVRALRRLGMGLGGLGWALSGVGAVGWLAAGALAGGFRLPERHVDAVVRAGLASGLVLVVASRALAGLERRGASALALVGVLAGGSALGIFAGIGARDVVKTARHLGEAVAAERRPGDLVASYRRFMQSLCFYARTRVVQIDERSEIADGAARASDRDEWFWDGTERLEREWASGRRVFLATSWGKLGDLLDRLEPRPRLLAEDFRRILLVNFPAPGSRPLDPGRASARAGAPAPRARASPLPAGGRRGAAAPPG